MDSLQSDFDLVKLGVFQWCPHNPPETMYESHPQIDEPLLRISDACAAAAGDF